MKVAGNLTLKVRIKPSFWNDFGNLLDEVMARYCLLRLPKDTNKWQHFNEICHLFVENTGKQTHYPEGALKINVLWPFSENSLSPNLRT